MLEGKALDQFMDRFWGETRNEQLLKSGKSVVEQSSLADTSEDDLEEYELKEDGIIIQPIHKGKIEKRTWIGLVMFLAFVPLVLFILVHKFHGKHDVIISLLVLAYSMIPFFMVFEGRHPQAREIMVIAVMAALGVAGRSAFFMIGSFKPIAAIVILTGVSLGGEGRIPLRLSDHDDLKYVFRAGTLDSVADVLLWNDRISGWNSFSERDSQSQKD